jgi:hypothetical protein
MDLEKEAEAVWDAIKQGHYNCPGDVLISLRAVHDAAIEKAAVICQEREEEEKHRASVYEGHIREQSIAAAECAFDLCESIRALKIGGGK